MTELEALKKRFDSRYTIDARGCWIWSGQIHGSTGYGLIQSEGKTLRAHRASYLLHKGEIPEGMMVCHSCDVRECVNPDHLWLGTGADNMADMRAKGRGSKPPTFYGLDHHCGRKTHCPRGHEYTAENTYLQTRKSGRMCKLCVKARAKARKKGIDFLSALFEVEGRSQPDMRK